MGRLTEDYDGMGRGGGISVLNEGIARALNCGLRSLPSSGVARILLQGGTARVPKFVVTKSSRSESHLTLGLQDKHNHSLNGCRICVHSQTPGGTCPTAPYLQATPLLPIKVFLCRI